MHLEFFGNFFSFLTTIFGVFSKKLVYLFLGFFILENKSVKHENIKKQIFKVNRFVVAKQILLINITHSIFHASAKCSVLGCNISSLDYLAENHFKMVNILIFLSVPNQSIKDWTIDKKNTYHNHLRGVK